MEMSFRQNWGRCIENIPEFRLCIFKDWLVMHSTYLTNSSNVTSVSDGGGGKISLGWWWWKENSIAVSPEARATSEAGSASTQTKQQH